MCAHVVNMWHTKEKQHTERKELAIFWLHINLMVFVYVMDFFCDDAWGTFSEVGTRLQLLDNEIENGCRMV